MSTNSSKFNIKQFNTGLKASVLFIAALSMSGCSKTTSETISSTSTGSSSSSDMPTNMTTTTNLASSLSGGNGLVYITTGKDSEGTATSVVAKIGGTEYTFSNPTQDTTSDDKTLSFIASKDYGLTATTNVDIIGYAIGTNLGETSQTVTDLGMIIEPLTNVTSAASLPTSSATYNGTYVESNIAKVTAAGTDTSALVSSSGTFSATADFGATNSLSGTFTGGLLDQATISASNINPAFTGTITSGSDTGTFRAGFYGASAEDLAAVGSGTFSGTSTIIGMIGSR